MDFTIDFGYTKKEKIFDNLNISFRESKITVICGHNGAGKTTLLKLLSGILPRREKIESCWFVPTSGGMLQHFSIEQHLKILNVSFENSIVSEFINIFDMKYYLTKRYSTLSTGQKMLGSILVAVSSERKVLFLDEPFGCLDPSNAEKLISFFQKLSASGVTVVITSHDLYQCVLLADDVYIIKNGNISWNCNDLRENKITVDELTKIYNDKA